MMAKVLCVTSGLTGITNASMEVCRRLINMGYDVASASFRDKREVMELNGFKFVKFPEIATETMPEVSEKIKSYGRIVAGIYRIVNYRKRKAISDFTVFPDKFIEHIEKEKYDFIIIDLELHEYIIAAWAKKFKVILLCQWFSIWKRNGLPYILTDEIPTEHNWESINLYWNQIRVERTKIFRKKRLLSLATDRRSALLRLAKKLGFPLALIDENYWPGPFVYDQLPVISMTSEQLEFSHDKRPNMYYVGPMVFEQRKSLKSNVSISEKIDIEKGRSQTIILATFSTLKAGDSIFLDKIVEVFKEEPKWSLFIGLGGQLKTKSYKGWPSNIFAFDYIPQLEALKNADLSINHGGIHTINECIHFKVPMLVYSGKRSDQNGCAARVHHYGCGLMADKDLDTPEDIRKNINHILSDSRFHRAIENLNKDYQRNIENNLFEDTIIQLLNQEND